MQSRKFLNWAIGSGSALPGNVSVRVAQLDLEEDIIVLTANDPVDISRRVSEVDYNVVLNDLEAVLSDVVEEVVFIES